MRMQSAEQILVLFTTEFTQPTWAAAEGFLAAGCHQCNVRC